MPADSAIPVIKPSPKPIRGGRKLLMLIIVFFATLLIILFFQSSISKVSVIHITGNELVSSEEIAKEAGVVPGDHFFLVRKDKVKERLQGHSIIESAEVSKHFPGVVNITIKEFRRVGFQLAADGTREVLLADGSAVPIVGQAAGVPLDMPILSGWSPDDPLKKKLCAALAQIPARLLSDISEIKPAPSTAYSDKIKLYTRSKFEVYTTVEYLPGNLEYLGYITNELKDQGKTSGVITMLEQIRHAPFEWDKQPESKDGQAAAPAGSKEPSAKPSASPPSAPKPKESVKPGARG